jgi:hypothetical protein
VRCRRRSATSPFAAVSDTSVRIEHRWCLHPAVGKSLVRASDPQKRGSRRWCNTGLFPLSGRAREDVARGGRVRSGAVSAAHRRTLERDNDSAGATRSSLCRWANAIAAAIMICRCALASLHLVQEVRHGMAMMASPDQASATQAATSRGLSQLSCNVVGGTLLVDPQRVKCGGMKPFRRRMAKPASVCLVVSSRDARFVFGCEAAPAQHVLGRFFGPLGAKTNFWAEQCRGQNSVRSSIRRKWCRDITMALLLRPQV